MPSLKEQILNNVVQPLNNVAFDTTLARVTSYDHVRNRAVISFQDPKGPGLMEIEDVPVQIGSGGVHSAGPFEGDQVWVSFQNKSALHPKIVALADEGYQYKTRERSRHSRKGAFIPDSVCERKEYIQEYDTSNLLPASNDWFDYENKDPYKYIEFKDISPLEELQNETGKLSYYNSEEPGVTHPLNSSTIKVRNNGMIDIFVSTNHGIRIDPETRTINVMGNSEKHHVNDFSVFSDETANISAQKEINIDSKKRLSMKSKTISVDSEDFSVNSSGSWTINSSGDITVNGKSNVTVESGKDIILKAKNIIIDGNLVTQEKDDLYD